MTMMKRPPRKTGLDERVQAWALAVFAMAEAVEDAVDLSHPVVQGSIIDAAARLVVGADVSAVVADAPSALKRLAQRPPENPEAMLPTKCAVCGKTVDNASEATFKAIGWVHNWPSCLLEDPSLDPDNKMLRIATLPGEVE